MIQKKSFSLGPLECFATQPTYQVLEWAFEALKLFRQLGILKNDLETLINEPNQLRLTRDRLKQMHQHVEYQAGSLMALLSPIPWREVRDDSFAAYLNNLPEPSYLMEHFDLVFRDWVWGHGENDAMKKSLESVTSPTKDFGDVLVIGAGCGRLSYDFFTNQNLKSLTLVDYNPLLSLVAHAMFSGKEIELVEFSTVPQGLKDFSTIQRLKSPQKFRQAFKMVVADCRDPFYPPKKYQTILSPWIMDVIDLDLENYLRLVNSSLEDHGTWLNIGPIGFNRPNLSKYYSREETLYLIEKTGFEIQKCSYEKVPYMHNPKSNSHRYEQVLCFEAIKKEHFEYNPAHFVADSKESASLEDLKISESLVKGYTITARIFELLYQGKAVLPLSEIVASEFGLRREEVEWLAQSLMAKERAKKRLNPMRT